MRFWDVVKEVSAQPVRQEAGRLFVLALTGDEETVAAARLAVLGNRPTAEQVSEAEPFLFTASPPYSEADDRRLRHADLIVSLDGGPGITEFRPADTLRVERVHALPEAVLAHRPDLRIPLARCLPGFRDLAAEQVIRDVSRVNAEFAALSGVSEAIPFLAPLLPAAVGADILLLTKNQVMMIFRLAAIYGEDMSLKARSKEIAAIIGGAFGWRSIARQLLGVVPGGVGIPLRAGIAFTGTYATGRAVQMVFDEGRRPTREEMRRIYEEAAILAKETVGRVLERIGRRGKRDERPKELPAVTDAPRLALPPGELDHALLTRDAAENETL